MDPSPILPATIKAAVPDPTSSLCGGFVNALLKIPVYLYQAWNWLVDSSGNVTQNFRRQIIPPGFRMDSFVSITDPGWLLCDGSEVAQVTYPDLYAAIGASFGAAGVGNFKLPDCRARFAVSTGSFPSGASVSVGTTGGEEDHTLVEGEIPKIQLDLIAATGSDAVWVANDGTGSTKNGQSIGATGVADKPEILTKVFGADPPAKVTNLPPYFGVLTYIKT